MRTKHAIRGNRLRATLLKPATTPIRRSVRRTQPLRGDGKRCCIVRKTESGTRGGRDRPARQSASAAEVAPLAHTACSEPACSLAYTASKNVSKSGWEVNAASIKTGRAA